MAVIKIVPMPGAKGDQGDQGPAGAQGPQGETGLQGPAGADALWTYNGEWLSNATYAEGDIVTYDGQTYYATGITTLGATPDTDDNFDLIASKGEDGVSGIVPLTGTWETNFFTINEITSDETTYQQSSLGTYTVIGDMVFWDVHIIAFNPTFNNPEKGWTLTPPPFTMFPVINLDNHTGLSRGTSMGRFVARADESPFYNIEQIDDEWVETVPYGPDEFISIPLYVTINPIYMYLSFQDPNDINLNSDSLKSVSALSPLNLASETAINKYFRFQISGSYKRQLPSGSTGNAVTGDTSFAVNGGTTGTQPTFSGDPLFSGSYIRVGDLVHFQIQVDMDNITNFGTGQYFVDLPFNAKYGYQVREGCLHDISTGKQYSIGGHVFAGEKQLLLSFTDSNGQDADFDHNSPVTLSTDDNFHISGSYITSE